MEDLFSCFFHYVSLPSLRDLLWVCMWCPFHPSHPITLPGFSKLALQENLISKMLGLCSYLFSWNLLWWEHMGNVWFIQGVICILFKGSSQSVYMEDYYGLTLNP